MKRKLKSKSKFAKRADMFVAPTPSPISLPVYRDNSMPLRDWSKYDKPACLRNGKKVKIKFLSIVAKAA